MNDNQDGEDLVMMLCYDRIFVLVWTAAMPRRERLQRGTCICDVTMLLRDQLFLFLPRVLINS